MDLHRPFGQLSHAQQRVVLYGSGDEAVKVSYQARGRTRHVERVYEGVIPALQRRYRETESLAVREGLQSYMRPRPCAACQGTRLRSEAIAVRVHGRSISDITALSVERAERFFADLNPDRLRAEGGRQGAAGIARPVTFSAQRRTGILTLERAAATLSGGEGQRIRLATQIGSGLVGVLYILDEPSIGLHQRDNQRLLESLQRLRDLSNTVLVVEHDRDTINAADYVLDLGPGAGEHGGHVVAAGTPDEIRRQPGSLTGRYLSGVLTIPVPTKRRKPGKRKLVLQQATANNLKSLDVAIPLGVFVCVTGVSGSGKSTLVMDILYKALARRLYRTRERPGPFGALRGNGTFGQGHRHRSVAHRPHAALQSGDVHGAV